MPHYLVTVRREAVETTLIRVEAFNEDIAWNEAWNKADESPEDLKWRRGAYKIDVMDVLPVKNEGE